MRKIKALLAIFAFLLLVSLFWGYKNYQKFVSCQEANEQLMKNLREVSLTPKRSSFLEEGDALPSSLNLITLDGQPVSLAHTDTCLLIFITSTCPACLEVGLEIYSSVNEFENQGLGLISVSRDDHDSLVRLATEENWPMKLAQDRNGQLHQLFNLGGVPAMVLVHKGKVELKANALSIDRQLPRLKDLLNQYLETSKNDKTPY